MAQVNPLTREVLLKLVYYGPGLGGKTTSLQHVHASSPPETRGNIVSLATPVDRTLYFDFLPLRVPSVRGHPVRVQLFTVPGQVYFNATRKLLLTGADGVVFVADSQRSRQDANVESLENLAQNLVDQGRDLAKLPLVLQYNKRDIPRVVETEEMDRLLNPRHVPAFPTRATTGEGVLDALDALVRQVLDRLEEERAFGEPMGRTSVAPSFGRTESALEEQIGRASDRLVHDDIERAVRAAEVAKAQVQAESAKAVAQVQAESAKAVAPAPPDAIRAVAPISVRPAVSGVVASAAAAVVEVEDDDSSPTQKLRERGEDRPASQVFAREDSAPVVALPQPTPEPVERLPRSSVAVAAHVARELESAAPTDLVVASIFANESEHAGRIERSLRVGRFAEAVVQADDVALRVLANAAAAAGLGEGARDPAVVALCLGLDGSRWLSFRRTVRRARAGAEVSRREATAAYVLVCELALRRDAALG